VVAVYVGADRLLVRSSYHTGWGFPGGGVGSAETPKAAVRRELAEEIGLAAPALIRAGVINGFWDSHFRNRFYAVIDKGGRLPVTKQQPVASSHLPSRNW
jgi:8-oxo-dGTP pyrophosphatase MutT (NUDIX family)